MFVECGAFVRREKARSGGDVIIYALPHGHVREDFAHRKYEI